MSDARAEHRTLRSGVKAMALAAALVAAASSMGCRADDAQARAMPVGRWEVTRETGWRGTFYDVTFVSPTEGWAVGNTVGAETSLIAHTTDAGETWEQQDSGVIEPLRRVAFRGPLRGWIIGESGVVLRTTDGGAQWRMAPLATQDTYFDMHVPETGRMWIVGDFAAAYTSNDDGETWERRANGLLRASLRAVWFVDDDTGWVATWDGRVFHTTDAGLNWSPHALPQSAARAEITRLYFADSRHGLAIGDRRAVLRTADGGTTWEHVTQGSNERHTTTYGQVRASGDEPLHSFMLYDMAFAGRGIWLAGDMGAVLHSPDGGATWRHQLGGPTRLHGAHPVFRGVEFVNGREGWVVGEFGTIMHTRDAGETWHEQSPTGALLSGICFVGAERGWAAGDRGEMLLTVDGGATWNAQGSATMECFGATHFPDDAFGWAVAEFGTVMHTKDGGLTWRTQDTPVDGMLLDVRFADRTTGWAAGAGGVVIRTVDGGGSWLQAPTPTGRDLFALSFPTSTTGWVVGDGGTVLRTVDAGASWSPQASDLGEVWLLGVHFVDDMTGWLTAADGRMFHTSDGGESWATQDTGAQDPLYDVFFLDRENGWAVGGKGTILQTRDGGRRWRTRRSGTEVDLTDITFTGPASGWIAGEWGTILRYVVADPRT